MCLSPLSPYVLLGGGGGGRKKTIRKNVDIGETYHPQRRNVETFCRDDNSSSVAFLRSQHGAVLPHTPCHVIRRTQQPCETDREAVRWRELDDGKVELHLASCVTQGERRRLC